MSPILTAARALYASRDRTTTILSIVAIGLPHAVLLAVVGGVSMFHHRMENPVSDMWINSPHLAFSYIGATLLIVPALSMGAAAARLGLSRKARTLATLRLMGITPMAARVAAVIDTLVHAVSAVIVGSLLYVLTLPVWRFVSFHGVALGVREMWMGALPLLACGMTMLVLTALSSFVSMQKVAVTPLGVITKDQHASVSVVGLTLAVLFVVSWLVVSPIVMGMGFAVAVGVFLIFLGGTIALINVIGTFCVTIIGRMIARFARTPTGIVAGRRLAADPKAVWRSFGALGVVAFIAGVLLPVLQEISATPSPFMPQDMVSMLTDDIATGVSLTLGISTVLASVSTAMQQAIRAIDSAPQRHALADMGAPARFWASSRRKEVAYPAVVLIGGAVVMGLIFIAPVMSMGNPLWGVGGVLVTTLVAIIVIMISAESARLLERLPARA